MNDEEILEIYDNETNKLLVEYAIDKKGAIEKIEYSSPIIFEHLIKILLYGKECSCFEHWLQEINTKLTKLNDIIIKPDNKPIKFDYFKQYGLKLLSENEYFKEINRIIEIEHKFNPINKNELYYGYEMFKNLCINIFIWCSKKAYSKEKLREILIDILTNMENQKDVR